MIDRALDAARRRIYRKRLAYAQTFLDATGKTHPNADVVLADLRKVARMDRGGIVVSPVTRTVDPLATAYLAGQRDVYLRIVKFLGLDGAPIEGEGNE
jgi:hypothetical protein